MEKEIKHGGNRVNAGRKSIICNYKPIKNKMKWQL